MSLVNEPVWLITGCSTGFGREFCELALEKGGRVVATARNKDQVQDIADKAGDRALAVALDVNDDAQVKAAIEAAVAKFGRVDVLVNNAGYGYFAAVEEGEEDEVRAMFDTNVFGLAAMTRAVLPTMRAQKKGAIVNITSIGGLQGFPATGYYAATKFAVEGLSDSLAAEVKPLGIDVLIVEPGPFRTDWAGRSAKSSAVSIADYDDTAHKRRDMTFGYSGKQPGDPRRAGEAIIEALSADQPPLRLPLGKFAIETAKAKLDAVRADIDTWGHVGLATDFPAGE